MFKENDIVRHYKGNHYIIIGVATHTESGENLIIYRKYNEKLNKIDETDVRIWARPQHMFDDTVMNENNLCLKRFTRIEEE